jgi:hypothetical protein
LKDEAKKTKMDDLREVNKKMEAAALKEAKEKEEKLLKKRE